MGKWDKLHLWGMEQEETGRATSRLLEGSWNEATMAWTQVVAVETEGKRESEKIFVVVNSMIK